jgi:hypothetical protein
MPASDNELYIKGFSWGGLIFIILFCLFVLIITLGSAYNYATVLDNDDDSLPDSRGSITFYLWVNVIVGVFAIYIFILYVWKFMFGNKNPYTDNFDSLKNYANGILDEKSKANIKVCQEIGLKDPEDCKEFSNKILKSDKVAYYLEKARYVADQVNDKVDIHENIYERLCDIKQKAAECIVENLETQVTKKLYEIGGVVGETELNGAAKIASVKLITENNKDINQIQEDITELESQENLTNYINAEGNNTENLTKNTKPEEKIEELNTRIQETQDNVEKQNLKATKKDFEKLVNKRTNKNIKVDRLLRWEPEKKKSKK